MHCSSRKALSGLSLILCLGLLPGCFLLSSQNSQTLEQETLSQTEANDTGDSTPSPASSKPEASHNSADSDPVSEQPEQAEALNTLSLHGEKISGEPAKALLASYSLETDPKVLENSLQVQEIPDYSGIQMITLHNDSPALSWSANEVPSFEYYGDLDSLGRCTMAMASVGMETLPTAERGDISQIRPSGYRQNKYDFVDQEFVYNRCHLIAHCLSGENANPNNLITGTRSMNLAMVPLENEVCQYVKRTGSHVLYRTTPVFEEDDLVARGVIVEAKSIEDDGKAISFCRYLYNVEPGVEIDYSTGQNWLATEDTPTWNYPSKTPNRSAPVVPPQDEAPEASDHSIQTRYVANKNTGVYHYASCDSVKDMAEHNKLYTDNKDDLKDYRACKKCRP